MITLGLDPHPASHTVVALDESGVSLGHLTVPNTAEGTHAIVRVFRTIHATSLGGRRGWQSLHLHVRRAAALPW
jgi:hypothetical protein